MIKILPMMKLAVFGLKIPSTQIDKTIDTIRASSTTGRIVFLNVLLSMA
jgi:hypothetical protein